MRASASLGTSDKQLTALPSPGATLPFLEVFQPDPCLVQLCLAHATLHAGGTQEIGSSSLVGRHLPSPSAGDSPSSRRDGPSCATTPEVALMPKPSLVSLQQHHRAAGERNFLHEHHSQETSPSPDPPGEDGGWIQSVVQVEWRSSQQPGDSTAVRWSAHRDAEPRIGPGQVVAGLRRRRVKKHQLLKPRVWHRVHLAAGWWGWCGWVCVFCLVLFLLAMCHFGGGETFNNALPRSSRSVFHSSEPHCTAALSPVPEPFPSRRVRPPQNGSERQLGPEGRWRCHQEVLLERGWPRQSRPRRAGWMPEGRATRRAPHTDFWAFLILGFPVPWVGDAR